MIKNVNELKPMRSVRQVGLMIQASVDHVVERFLDPKNQQKGTHINTSPVEMYEHIIKESIECKQAYMDNEGFPREIEELSDTILLCVMRIDQIKKLQEKGVW